jgi:hypothetical protein
MGEYYIGVNHAGLTALSALTTPIVDPRSYMMEYRSPIVLGNLRRKDLGYVYQIWHWDIMTLAAYVELIAYEGAVNVVTRNNAGTMDEYTGIFVRPEREPERFAGRVLDVSFEIRELIVYP